MSQTSITSFYNSRKRPATDEIFSTKNKLAHIERTESSSIKRNTITTRKNRVISADDKDLKTLNLLDGTKPKVSKICLSSPVAKDVHIPQTVFAKKASNIIKNVDPKSDTLNVARKELSLGDIRKKLAGSSRLAELKATADRLSAGIQQLKQSSEAKNLKGFKSIDVEVPTSPCKKTAFQKDLLSPTKEASSPSALQHPFISPRKVFVSPVKSPSKVPAYIKHAALATSSTSLPLPHHYRFLAELFRGMETVVSLLHNRHEKITFKKLKPSVQEMLKRNFTEKHLAQIKYLVPDFYNFEIQKIINFTTSTHKDQYDMVITPNLPNDISVMNPSVLLERRRYFYDTLLQVVKKHHALFLQSLDPPMNIPDDKLVRWHPEFELEKVADIESAKLPELPNVEKFSTAQDVLTRARELFKCNTKMERAMEKLAEAKSRGLTEKEREVTKIVEPVTNNSTQTPSTSAVTLLNPALRNLPASLLEKVKAKQAAKALEAMTRSSEQDHNYVIYSRLPDLARTLRNIFVTERKNVLALNIILSKLDSSFKSNISANDLQRDIKVLAEEVPDFIKLHSVRNTSYLKLDKNADLKAISSKLDSFAAKYKK